MAHDETAVAALAGRLFPHAGRPVVERMMQGASTRVYRLCCGDGVYYLRVLPEEGAGFAAEVLAHRLLRERGVRVPEVVYVEHYHPLLQRSVMVTTEVRGYPVRASAGDGSVRRVLHEAGRQVALINAVPVQGFGWIKRDEVNPRALAADLSTWEAFVHAQVDEHLPRLAHASTLPQRDVQAIERVIDHCVGQWPVAQATLAHGDLDATHIYREDSTCSGIIDFGEIPGTAPYYDLGWFAVEDGAWLPYLLEGYASVASLPADYEERVRFAGLYIAVDRLGR